MKHTVSLNRNTLFRRAYYKGANHANSLLALYIIANKASTNRMGITVSKKVGKAVVRNRIKRLIKENYRLTEHNVKNGFDLVVVARSKAAGADYKQIGSALLHLLKKASLYSGMQ